MKKSVEGLSTTTTKTTTTTTPTIAVTTVINSFLRIARAKFISTAGALVVVTV